MRRCPRGGSGWRHPAPTGSARIRFDVFAARIASAKDPRYADVPQQKALRDRLGSPRPAPTQDGPPTAIDAAGAICAAPLPAQR
ncbi:hypothetical protein ABZT04_25210 [Streptomyces sp. NPDC005492]|uniref:hypothetical protein n=1 Tax=Streptomyces sp. NPDC005492 TaxID=3156883 RepID=UPI0033A1C23B